MNWIDIVFIAILVVFAVIGLWRGLFDSLLGLISSGVALTIAIFTAKSVSKFLNKTLKINNWFAGMLEKTVGESGNITLFGKEALTFPVKQVAEFLSVVFAIIVVFVLIKLAVWLLAKLFDSVASASTIGSGLNKVLGLVFGVLRGGVALVCVLSLCCVFNNTGLIGNTIQDNMDKTKITKYVYKYVSDYTEKLFEKADMAEYIKDAVKSSQPAEETPASEAVNNPNDYTITFEM